MKAKEIKNNKNQSVIFDELAWTPPLFFMRNPHARIESEFVWDGKRNVEKKQEIC